MASKKKSVPNRMFLNRGSGHAFYEISNEAYYYGPNLEIGDCSRQITLDFNIDEVDADHVKLSDDRAAEKHEDPDLWREDMVKSMGQTLENNHRKAQLLIDALTKIQSIMRKRATNSLKNMGMSGTYYRVTVDGKIVRRNK